MIFFQTKPVFMAGFVSSGAHEIFTVYPLSFLSKNAIILLPSDLKKGRA